MAVRYSKDLPGQSGMVILEYAGGNAGDETWIGPETRTTYLLGGSRKRGYVDKRDAPGLLALRDKGKPVFVVVEPVEETKPVLQTEIAGAMPDWEKGKGQEDLSGLSVSALKKKLPDLGLVELEATYAAEKAGKSRSSALNAIEAEIDARLA